MPRSVSCLQRPILHGLMTLACLLSAVNADSQGSLGFTPDPITVLERERLLESVSLSGDAREEFVAAYERYLDQCRALREGPVESLIGQLDVLQPNSLHDASPYDEARRALKDWQDAWDRFIGNERSLLASWQALISVEGMPHFEDFARRRRLDQLIANGAVAYFLRHNALLDLRATVDDLTLDQPLRDRIEPLLRAYETAQIVQLERIRTEGVAGRRRFIDALREAGFPGESWDDGTATIEAQQAALARWWDAEANAQEAYQAFQSEQMTRALALADMLPPEEAFAVRGAAAWAHGATFLRNRMRGHAMIDLLLADSEIDGETRDSLEAIRQQVFVQHRQTTHEVINLHLADRGSNIRGSSEYYASEQQRVTKRREITNAFVEFDRSIQQQIASLIPAETMDAVRQQHQQNQRARGDAIIAEHNDVARFGRMSESAIAFMPPRITGAEVDAIATLLDLDDVSKSRWNEMVAQFLAETNDQHIAWSRQLNAAVPDYTLDEVNRVLVPAAIDSIEAFPAVLAEVRNHMRAAEAALHTALIDVLPQDDLLRSRAIALLDFDQFVRAHVQPARSVSESSPNFTGHRANPVTAIANARLTARDRTFAIATLLHQRGTIEAACINSFNASLQGFLADWRYRRAMHEYQFESREEAQNHPSTQEFWRSMDGWRDARRNLIQAMRDLHDGIAAELEPIPAAQLRNAYRQAAWPQLYGDPAALFTWFGRAIMLEGLDDHRIVELTLKEDDYRRAYEDLTERMVRTLESSPTLEIRARDVLSSFYDRRHRSATVQRWWWERRELSARAWLDAMELLTEVEREQLVEHEPMFDGELLLW